MAYKLFYLLLGCTPAGRHTEQHDVFFCIGKDLKDIIPDIKAFWRGSGKIHIDSWREVTAVDGCRISIIEKAAKPEKINTSSLSTWAATYRVLLKNIIINC
ncbi:DUF1543 domain-containing protein [Niabella defluvii]|nr:DUF1543 domain-containing protein [Niabella sp. I65]